MEFTWIIIVAFLLFGLLFIIAELLVIPGTSLVGIAGACLMAAGIYGAYQTFGAAAGHITVAVSVVISAMVIYASFKYGTWKKMGLAGSIDSRVNVVGEEEVKVGDHGKTVSRLAPSGKARLNGKYYEVHTFGEFVNEGTDIIVVKRESGKVIVKPAGD